MNEAPDVLTRADDRIDQLLLRWQELRDRGEAASAEQLAAEAPELAGELQRRIRALEQMEDLLDLGRPTGPGSTADPPRDPDATRPYAPDDAPALAPAPAGLSVPGYRIVGLISRGGMGVVYQAVQEKLGREVALKMILSGRHAGPLQLQRFRSEADAVARLNHPHIVQIYEVGEHDGQPYYAMEFVAGGNLAQRLARGPLPTRDAAGLLATLADAVAYAHERGVLHRDLKPANVLLAADGAPKVADFGLAKRLDLDSGQTPTTAILGTPSYMAPEQAEGKMKEVGPAADIYALGAILYELLAGRPPFRGETEVDTLSQVKDRDPVPPSRFQPRVPRDLETICLKCLQKEPARRYATAAALADDLRRFLDGRPIAARRTPWWEAGQKWARRHPAWAALLAVSVTAAAALLLVWVRFTTALQEQYTEAVVQRGNAEEEKKIAVKERNHAWAAQRDADEQLTRSQELLTRCLDSVVKNARDLEQVRQSKETEGLTAAAFYTMAAVYAETADAYSRDDKLNEKDRLLFVEAYDGTALELLKTADKYEYFLRRPYNVEKLNKDPRLARLRQQQRFKDWVKKIHTN